MAAYLVRTIEEHDLVGVFYAPNTYSLAFMIDEVLDPDDCEYLVIGPGGIVWSERAVEIPVPSQEGDEILLRAIPSPGGERASPRAGGCLSTTRAGSDGER